MKRFFTAVLALLFTLAFGISGMSCFLLNTYKLTVDDPSGILIEDYKGRYEAGEKVTVKRGVVCDVDVSVALDGEVLNANWVDVEGEDYYEYTFTMPNRDVTLTVNVVGGFGPIYYRLTVVDEGNHVINELLEYYPAEAEVVVKTPPYSGIGLEAYLDNEYLGVETPITVDGRYTHCEFRFTMPDHDATLTIVLLGTIVPPSPPKDEVKYETFTVHYDYDLQNARVISLLDGCEVFFDAETYGVAPWLAGDQITVYHTGELYIREIYPSTVVIEGGEVVDVKKYGASLVKLEYTEGGWYLLANGRRRIDVELPEYVINEDGTFQPLSEITSGTVLYATQKDRGYDDGWLRLSAYALYSYYPLPIVESETLFPWIEALKNVTRVKMETCSSCLPDEPVTIKTSETQADIDNVLSYLREVAFREVPASEWQVDGGGVVRLTVYTATEEHTLTFGAGYVVVDGVGYKPDREIPAFTAAKTTLGFNDASATALYINGEKVKEYGSLIGLIQFVETDDPLDTYYIDYRLRSSFIELRLHDEKYFFCQGKTYKIVGETDLSEIFEEFPSYK